MLNRTLAGLENCRKHKLITGVATSVCQTNFELVSEEWLRRLIDMGVHYAWFHTYRVVGPKPAPQLALTPEQVLQIRKFIVEMRSKLPIAIVDAYWDDKGEALCPMATGVSHHIGPGGDIEPCPIIQFAKETIRDERGIYDVHEQLGVPQRLPRDRRQDHARLHRAGAAGHGERAGRQARRDGHDPARHGRWRRWRR